MEELGRERARALAEARGRSVIHPSPYHRAANARPSLSTFRAWNCRIAESS